MGSNKYFCNLSRFCFVGFRLINFKLFISVNENIYDLTNEVDILFIHPNVNLINLFPMAVEKFSILQVVDHSSYELCCELCCRKELTKLEKKQ